MRHKHADIIIAWAEGAKIEYRSCSSHPWSTIKTPSWDITSEYRVKEPVIISYRTYLRFEYALGLAEIPYSDYLNNLDELKDKIEKSADFLKWESEWKTRTT